MAKIRRHIITLEGERVSSFRDDFASSTGNTNPGRHRYRLNRSVASSFCFYWLLLSALICSTVYVIFGEVQLRAMLEAQRLTEEQMTTIGVMVFLYIVMLRVVYLLLTHEHRVVSEWVPVKAKVLGMAVAQKRVGKKVGKVWILNVYFEFKKNPYIAKGFVYVSHMQKEFNTGDYIPILVDPKANKYVIGMVIDPRIMKRI